MEILASDLKEVLIRLSFVLTNKGQVESSNKFIFAEDSIYVFDGETLVSAEFKTGVSGAVEGNSFAKYIEKMGTSQIELIAEDGRLDVVKGSSIASFVLDEAETSPVSLDKIGKWRETPSNFSQALQACSYTVGKDLTDMRTVVVHIKGEFAESTDEERLTRFRLDSEMKFEMFIPSDLIPFLTKNRIVSYSVDEEWTYFKNQMQDIVCHRNISFGEEYADLGEIVEQCSEGKPIELPEKMYDAIEKASIFQANVKVESEKVIKVSCRKNKIKIVSEGAFGNFSETLSCSIEEKFSFLINPSFLMQIIEKSNTVLFHPDYIKISTDDYVYITSLPSEETE